MVQPTNGFHQRRVWQLSQREDSSPQEMLNQWNTIKDIAIAFNIGLKMVIPLDIQEVWHQIASMSLWKEKVSFPQSLSQERLSQSLDSFMKSLQLLSFVKWLEVSHQMVLSVFWMSHALGMTTSTISLLVVQKRFKDVLDSFKFTPRPKNEMHSKVRHNLLTHYIHFP